MLLTWQELHGLLYPTYPITLLNVEIVAKKPSFAMKITMNISHW